MANTKASSAKTAKPEKKTAASEEKITAAAAKEAPAEPVKAKPAAKTASKPAAKTAAKPAAKTAAKTTAKTAKKPAAKAAPAEKKKSAKKTKAEITLDDVVAKIYKRIDKTAGSKVAAEGKAAVDIKLYGAFEAHMYIEVKDGVVDVKPYDYIEKDLEAALSVETALAIADGKISVKDAVADGSLYVFGNAQFALKFAMLF